MKKILLLMLLVIPMMISAQTEKLTMTLTYEAIYGMNPYQETVLHEQDNLDISAEMMNGFLVINATPPQIYTATSMPEQWTGDNGLEYLSYDTENKNGDYCPVTFLVDGSTVHFFITTPQCHYHFYGRIKL
jgi:hypothetical protein